MLFYASSSCAEKTDVLLLVNGDTVTGEIKSLDFAALKYSTDSMGTVVVDWEDVVTVTSNQHLQIEITSGERFFGNLIETHGGHRITVVTEIGPVELENNNIARITPIEISDHFINKLDGSLSFGLNSQKGSQVSTFNLASDIRYRALSYLVALNANSSITDQPGQETSSRHNISGIYQRFGSNRWFNEWLINWERNDEQGILARTQIGAAYGRYIVQTNKNQLSIKAGLAEVRETFVGDIASETKAEGLVEFRYLHRKLIPEASASLVSTVYPTVSDFSKFRIETDLSFRREFIADLFFDLSLYHSYLSEPPPGSFSTDYGFTTSLGYSF
jgi:hypothetical protein